MKDLSPPPKKRLKAPGKHRSPENEAVFPHEPSLFASPPHPASVIITPTPGSGITTNRKAIEGIQRLVRLAANVLQDENIVITDNRGNILNAFIFESGFKPQGPGGVSSNVPLLSCLGQRNLGIYAILAKADLKEQQSHG